MDQQSAFRIKPLLLSWAAGAVFVLVLFVLGTTGIAPRVARTLLNPGLLISGLAGYGAHEVEAIVVAIVGDSVLYGFLFFAALIARNRYASRSSSPPTMMGIG